jgi:ribosome-binding factor A
MKQMSQRQIQAGEIFKRTLSEFWIKNDSLITGDLKNITFTEVRLTPDFSTALVFYTHSLDDKEIKKQLKEINKSIRYKLAKILNMKTMPQIKFEKDDSQDYAKKIESLLNSDKVKKDLQS